MAEKIAMTLTEQPAPIAGSYNVSDLDTFELSKALEKAGSNQQVWKELVELEDLNPRLRASMFPESEGKIEDQAAKLQLLVKQALQTFFVNPTAGASLIAGVFARAMKRTPTLSASLVGPPIGNLPNYQPLYTLGLMKAPARSYQSVKQGDSIEYETAVTVNEAQNFNPEGSPIPVKLSGSKASITPYFKRTHAYTIDFFEWAERLIPLIVIKKSQLRQELDRSWDTDYIALFDAVYPNGTRYSSHPTHKVTTASNVSWENFCAGADLFVHGIASTDTSGTAHAATPGFAICDPRALSYIRKWGNDQFTETTVEQIVRNGWGVQYDGSVVIGQSLLGFALIQNSKAMAEGANTYAVRMTSIPQNMGYFVPITVNGSQTYVRSIPMVGDNPDFGVIRNSNTPPGFEFYIEAWEGGCMQIIGYFHTALLSP